jgi:HEPN domain-containing protein
MKKSLRTKLSSDERNDNMNELYDYVMDRTDYKRIEKLIKITNKETFWDEVRKLTKNVTSDKYIRRWQGLAELRYNQLVNGKIVRPGWY